MQPVQNVMVWVVDDDADVRQALAWLLRSRGLTSQTFDSAEAFWAHLQSEVAAHTAFDKPTCLLLDVRMPGMSGLALFDVLLAHQWLPRMPVIFLTGHADIATAVDTVKRGAFDFCEKPLSDNRLVDRVEQALQLSGQRLQAQLQRQRLQLRVAALTEREQAVMRLVVAGMPNKLIADQLTISVRTVEVHRARVFDKMAVRSAVELANCLRDDA